MIYLCPFCGHQLSEQLRDGISDCSHCHRVFDSSKYNRLLAASWVMRKNPDATPEQLVHMTKLSLGDAILVHAFVGENLYSHDEFQAYLKTLGVTGKIAG